MIADRQSGSMMLELMIGLSLLLVGILAFVNSFMSNYQAFNTVNELDEVHSFPALLSLGLCNTYIQSHTLA